MKMIHRRHSVTSFSAFTILFAVAALCGCVQQPERMPGTSPKAGAAVRTKDYPAIDYARYIKGSVRSFFFSSLDDWDAPDASHVVVWVNPLEAYRLTLFSPCFNLRYTYTIFLTSHGGSVSAGRDSVIVSGDRCGILTIDRLDARAIRAAKRAQKAAKDHS